MDIIDTAKIAESRGKQLVDALQTYQTQLQQRDANRIADAQQDPGVLQSLGNLSQSAAKLAETIGKQDAENKEIGVIYDGLVGRPTEVTPFEQASTELTEEARQKNAEVSAAADRVYKETGSELAAESVRLGLDPEGLARGYRNQTADLLGAQGAYGPFMRSMLYGDTKVVIDGNTYSMRQLTSSGDARLTQLAIDYAQSEFFRNYEGGRLLGASKSEVVSSLRGIIPNVNSGLANEITAAAIRQQKEDEKNRLSGEIYGVARTATTTGELQSAFSKGSELLYSSGVYMSRASANGATVKILATALEQRGDIDGLNRLREVYKIQRADGTYQGGATLGDQYSLIIDEAIARAQAVENRNLNNQKKVIANQFNSRMLAAGSTEEKAQIIDEFTQIYINNGFAVEAQNLQMQKGNYIIDNGAKIRTQEMREAIRRGELTSVSQIEEARDERLISEEQANSLIRTLGEQQVTAKPKDKVDADVVSDQVKAFTKDLEIAMGFKKDSLGNLIAGSAFISKSDFEQLKGQAERDLNQIANTWLRTEGRGLNEFERITGLQKVLREWYTQNVNTPGGKYYMEDILTKRRNGTTLKKDFTAEERERFGSLLSGNVAVLMSPYSGSNSTPQQNFAQSDPYNDDTGVSTNVRENFNPFRGDKIFDQDDIQEMADLYKKDGDH